MSNPNTYYDIINRSYTYNIGIIKWVYTYDVKTND